MATPDYNRLWEDLKKKQDKTTSGYYQSQRDVIKTNANEQRRQADISHQKSMRSLPAQMARLGLKGTGAAESSLIQANNAYEELLNSIRNEELASERDLYAAAASNAMKSTRTGGTGNPKGDDPKGDKDDDAKGVKLTYGLGADIVQNPLGPELYSVERDSKGNITKWTPIVYESGGRVVTQKGINSSALLHDPNMAYASLLEDMYRDGKISKETYRARLAGLGLVLTNKEASDGITL